MNLYLLFVTYLINKMCSWKDFHPNNIEYLNYMERYMNVNIYLANKYGFSEHMTLGIIKDFKEYIACECTYIHQKRIARSFLKQTQQFYDKYSLSESNIL